YASDDQSRGRKSQAGCQAEPSTNRTGLRRAAIVHPNDHRFLLSRFVSAHSRWMSSLFVHRAGDYLATALLALAFLVTRVLPCEVFRNSAHRFFCASAIRFLAAALILRLRRGAEETGDAAAGLALPSNRLLSSAIFSSMRFLCTSKPSKAAVRISIANFGIG